MKLKSVKVALGTAALTLAIPFAHATPCAPRNPCASKSGQMKRLCLN